MPQSPPPDDAEARAMLALVRTELGRLRQVLRPLLEKLPADDLIRMGDAASRGDRVALADVAADAAVGQVIDGEISVVLLEELHAILAERGLRR
jgi:hypothetical protein